MQIQSLRPFGALVTGCSLDMLNGGQVTSIRKVLCRSRVLVVRNQVLTDTGFADFLARLGEPMFTIGEAPVPGEPRLNVVSNVGRNGPGKRPPRSVFHTDTSYVERPPAFTALRAVTVSEHGGATQFSDQVTAASHLPMMVRQRLLGCRVRHAYKAVGHDEEVRWHPALRRHPETGSIALYLSTPERCNALSDTPQLYAKRAIAALYRRSVRPTALYRHIWRRGDVVVWDNRTTMHRADHSAVRGDRVLHRGMVRGEKPEAA